jgi:hypothetical protein
VKTGLRAGSRGVEVPDDGISFLASTFQSQTKGFGHRVGAS